VFKKSLSPLLPLQRDLIIHPHPNLPDGDIPHLTNCVDAELNLTRPKAFSAQFYFPAKIGYPQREATPIFTRCQHANCQNIFSNTTENLAPDFR